MDVLVGVGTLALAFATVWLALATHQLAGRSSEQVEIARVALERAHRPVIVPASSQAELAFRIGTISDAGAGPVMHAGKLAVPVENVGMGPALNLHGECAALAGGSTWGTGLVLHPVEGVAAGAANAITFVAREGDLSMHPELALRLFYEDVAGRLYWTALHFNQSERGYTCETGERDLPERLRILSPQQPSQP
jgi:hypothetical protein